MQKKTGGNSHLSSYSPKPFKVENPSVQTAPPENLSPGRYPSKETFPEARKKEL